MIVGYEKGNWVSLALEAIDNEAPLWFGHGCNCQKMMGAGVASQVRDRIPKLYQADQKTDTNKLGMWSAWFPIGDQNFSLVMYNLYTQEVGGRDARLGAIKDIFSRLDSLYTYLRLLKEQGAPFGAPQEMVIPMIGAGIGGLKWSDVAKTIDKATPDLPVRVIEWDGSNG